MRRTGVNFDRKMSVAAAFCAGVTVGELAFSNDVNSIIKGEGNLVVISRNADNSNNAFNVNNDGNVNNNNVNNNNGVRA